MHNLVTGRVSLVTGRVNLVTGRVNLVTGWVNLVPGRVVPTSSRINETKNNRQFASSSPRPPPHHPRSLRSPHRKQKRRARHQHGSLLKRSSNSTRNFWNGEIADCSMSPSWALHYKAHSIYPDQSLARSILVRRAAIAALRARTARRDVGDERR